MSANMERSESLVLLKTTSAVDAGNPANGLTFALAQVRCTMTTSSAGRPSAFSVVISPFASSCRCERSALLLRHS